MRAPNLHYARLGLRPGASKEQLTTAYRAAAMKHHPDRGGDSATFAAIHESYQAILSNSIPLLYTPSSMRSHNHSQDWNDIWGIMGAVVFPTALGLGVAIRLMYSGGEYTGLRAGGTSRFSPDAYAAHLSSPSKPHVLHRKLPDEQT